MTRTDRLKAAFALFVVLLIATYISMNMTPIEPADDAVVFAFWTMFMCYVCGSAK